MPTGTFYGRCETGPELILTDEQAAQRKALKQVWSGTRQLLCLFHTCKGSGDDYGKRSKGSILKTERTLCSW